MFELRTLGRVELRGPGGKPVERVQTRSKDLALLVYLAAARPFGFQRRDALLALLWPDRDETHARNALSQTLHRLRASMLPGIIVVRGREEVGFAPGTVSCDVACFDRHLETGDVAAALELYAGEFLAGFHTRGAAAEFDDWIEAERERLRHAAFNAIRVAVEVEEAHGNQHLVVDWLRKAAAICPLDETVARKLMRALAGVGDGAAALGVYERFEARVAAECGERPSARIRTMAEAIRNGEAAGRLHDRGTLRNHANPAVREACLRGRYFTSTLLQTGRGLDWLQRAIELDAACAPAHAFRAMGLANLALLGRVPPDEARAGVRRAAGRALDLDDGLADAHTALALARVMFDWNWAGAEREFGVALACNADSADAHAYFAAFLSASGRHDESIAHAASAHQLDPIGPWTNFVLGWTLYRARRYRESLRRLQALVELSPHMALAYLFIAENHVQTGSLEAAAEACRSALAMGPDDQLLLGTGACVLGLAGERQLACGLLDRLTALARSRYVSPGYLAAAYAGLGDRDRAFQHWDAMCRDRSSVAFLVPNDPLYDCVRDDPRFVALARRLDLGAGCAVRDSG